MSSALQPIPLWSFHGGSWLPRSASSPAGGATPAAAAPPRSQLTLLTWNVWFGRHRFRERTAALLDEITWRAPDVIALQEVTEELLELLLAHPHIRAFYQLSDADGSTFERYGVLLLTKIPFVSTSLLPLPSQMGRRLLVGQLPDGLAIATVHLESTSACTSERIAQLRIIQPLLAAEFSDVVLMGDMNFAPESAAETAALDPSFVDAWLSNRFTDPGYTVDVARNDLRRRTDDAPTQRRIDRVFVRSARWRTEEISLTGVSPIDGHGTFTSDHFGLEALLGTSPP